MRSKAGQSRRNSLLARATQALVERLEGRQLLSTAPANEIATLSGRVDSNTTINVPFGYSTNEIASTRGSVVFGLRVSPKPGSKLNPGSITVFNAEGKKVKPNHSDTNLPKSIDSYVVVDLLPGQYSMKVAGERGTTGDFDVSVLYVGDIDGNRRVDDADRTRMVDLVRRRKYLREADANLTGALTSFDTAHLLRNLGSRIEAPIDQPDLVNPIADISVLEDSSPTVLDISSVFVPSAPGQIITYTVESVSDNSPISSNLVGTNLTLTPLTNQNGISTVRVRAQSSPTNFIIDEFQVNVTPVNDAPTAVPTSLSTYRNEAVEVDLRTLVSDVETRPADLSFFVSNAVNGTVELIDGHIARYTPSKDFSGNASFTFFARDTGDGNSPPLGTSPLVIPVRVRDVDLTVQTVRPNVTYQGQLLRMEGTISAEIVNLGTDAIERPFQVLFFEDVDNSQSYTTGDFVFGQQTVAGNLPAGMTRTISANVSGPNQFSYNLIWALVDSQNAVPERNESNNLANSGEDCVTTPVVGVFDPVVEWNKREFSENPTSNQVMMTPAAIDLNNDRIADVVFTTFIGGNYFSDGTLRAISGDNGSELWSITDPQYRAEPGGDVAVGDIDSDGLPEVIAISERGEIIVFENDGTFKWRAPTPGTSFRDKAPAIADLDHDGVPEIVVGNGVLNADGSRRWSGGPGSGGAHSVVVDLNLDGDPEIVAGNTAYRANGSVVWNSPVVDGFDAIGNFDADPNPEIVVVGEGNVYLLEHDGTVKWGPQAIPGGGFGGPPTVADVDGDGQPEIGVAGGNQYVVFEPDGSIKWQRTTQDGSSQVTGSSVFDFEGDGTAEIIYGDELFLRVYKGLDGTVLYQLPKGSGTLYELPLVVDIDGDGNAEIVAVANDYYTGGQRGIFVIGSASDSWANTRTIWNQHSYHINNVNDDGTIPAFETPSWLDHNTYRLNLLPGKQALAAPDLAPSFIQRSSVGSTTTLTARVGNGGAIFVNAGVKVAFYNADPRQGGTLLGVATTTKRLSPGEYETVGIEVPATLANSLGKIWVVADDDGTGRGTVRECDEVNNFYGIDLNSSGEIGGVKYLDDTDANAIVINAQVNGTSNPYLAGMPNGTTASIGDSAPSQSPVLVPGLSLHAGQIISFASSGGVRHGPSFSFSGPDGGEFTPHDVTSSSPFGAENGISGYVLPIDSLIGVFLGPDRPDLTTAPVDLDFRNGGNVSGGINYVSISPELKQVFFIGDGVNSAGIQQEVAVPNGATRLFLATSDGHSWFNNEGSFSIQISTAITETIPAWPIYLDLNENGALDDGEPQQQTNSEGEYSFVGLPAGRYVVREVQQSGWEQTYPANQQLLHGPTPYLSREDRPFAEPLGGDNYFYLEDFEDGLLNTPGVTVTPGRELGVPNSVFVAGPGAVTDSVDADDGVVDGSGQNGHVLTNVFNAVGSSAEGIRVAFDANVLGRLPNVAGIVWTDGTPLDTVVFEAFDFAGVMIGRVTGADIGDGNFNGGTAEDRFFGIQSPVEIASFTIYGLTRNANAYEVDHLQYGRVPLDGHVVILKAAEVVRDKDFGNRRVAGGAAISGSVRDGSTPAGLPPGFYGPLPYLSKSDSPFNERLGLPGFVFEDVEDGVLTLPGAAISSYVISSQVFSRVSTDSVDADDGSIDGLGQQGESIWAPGNPGISITFGANGEVLPTHAGLVWTDGGGQVFFEVFGADGSSMYQSTAMNLPDGSVFGTTGEDRFLGFVSHEGISKIRVWNTEGGIEIDHIQYGPLTQISDWTVYLDQNFNGQRDPFELSTLTDAQGNYSFTNLPAGDYVVRQQLQPNWSVVSPTGGLYSITLAENQVVGGLDFVNRFAPALPSNRPPRVTSVPPSHALAGRELTYQITATDPDNDPIGYVLLSGPDGATLTPEGLLTWTPTTEQAGQRSFEIEVADDRGGRVVHRFNLNVVGVDIVPPSVQLFVSTNLANAGETIQLQVIATDNVEVAAQSLSIAGQTITLDVNGRGTFTSTTPGVFKALATAVDTSGNVGSATIDLRLFDPTDNLAPVITITSPTFGSTVTYLTDIIGSVQDQNLEYFEVQVAPVGDVNTEDIAANDPDYRTIFRGTSNVSNARLATFDPTLLRNDEYLVRVYAQDVNGLGRYDAIPLSVLGNAKLGEFSLEFTDLTIPLAGIPIEIRRQYSTFDSSRSGDFGFGWKMGLREADIRETVPDTGLTLFEATPFKLGTRVYINTPDGDRVGFTFKPVVHQFTFFGPTYRAVFEPDPGVNLKLDYDGAPGEFTIVGNGEARLFLFGIAWNPDNYVLTTREGNRYRYGQRTEIKDITDLNNNKVTFSDTAITHSSGESIQLVRDAERRIDKIIAPDGSVIDYTYNFAGDLISVEDQEDNVTTISYLTNPKHYLDEIVDPLGRRGVRTEYDASGRLVAVIDANGNRVEQSFDPAAFSGTRRDANGNVTNIFYNDRGNVLREVDPLGGVMQYAYEDPANPDKETRIVDKLGRVTQQQFDARGNLTRRVDPAGGVTTNQYNAQNSVTRTSDALGRVTNFVYSPTNNLSILTNAAGSVSSFGYDAQGRLVSSTDFRGNITRYAYSDGSSQPVRVTNPDGSFRTLEYNEFGQVTRQTNERGHPTLFRYDDIGRLTEEENALGQVTRRTYDAANNLLSVADPLGSLTRYEYDNANRLIKETNAEGGIVAYTYDANGNRKSLRDPVGNITRWHYDSQNRVIEEIDPLGTSKFFAYDAVGNQTRITDRLNRVRTFTYDLLNRVDLERWLGSDGSTVLRTIDSDYDAVGNLLRINDPDSTYVYTFDALNRVISVDNAGSPNMPHVILNYRYDLNGNQTKVFDNFGVTVESVYDNRNRMETRLWYGGEVDDARVDFDYCTCGALNSITRYASLNTSALVGTSIYVYDDAMRLTKLTHNGPTDNVLVNYVYTYDAASRVNSETSHGESVTYTYDRTGQLTDADRTNSQLPDEYYRYDANGNRTASHLHGTGYVTGPGNRLLSDGTFNYTYDAEGNMATKTAIATGNVTTYTYDHRNRLTGIVERSTGGVSVNDVKMVYDPLGRRIAEISNATVLRVVHNGNDTWLDSDGSNQVTARYLLGNRIDQMLTRWKTDGGVGWYLSDNLGSIGMIISSTGQVIGGTRDDSFGRRLSSTGLVDRFGFTGREQVTGADLLNFRTRHAASSIGRFIQPDKIGFRGGDANLFRYAGNSPASFTDPFGESIFGEYSGLVRFSVSVLKSPGFYLPAGFVALLCGSAYYFDEVVYLEGEVTTGRDLRVLFECASEIVRIYGEEFVQELFEGLFARR